jgi:hypothetical protein
LDSAEPTRPEPALSGPTEEPEEISNEEIIEADDSLVADPAPSASRLEPWFAQLAHGYCPPEGAQFAQPFPPTNFPGRDETSPETPVKP